MQPLDLTIICSAMPGFIRSIGSVLAGKVQQLQCYSVSEAGQMMQMHTPDFAVVDLRNADRVQCDQFWALLQNTECCRCVVVVVTGDLPRSGVPVELSERVQVVEQCLEDADLQDVAAAVVTRMTGFGNGQSAKDAEKTVEPARKVGFTNKVIPPVRNRTTVPEVEGCAFGRMLDPNQSIADRYYTQTPELRRMLERLQVVTQHDVTILLIGETGSGKTHLAKLIHEASVPESEPFVTVACGALPAELIESELFGHMRGSFTSAHMDKEGKFLAAGRGTILLDEIDVLTPEQQVKLLRVIETGQFEAVGSNKTETIQARIISASNMELQPLVEQGRFRSDLYYRLNTFTFTIPPLRKRLPDIEPLVRYFVHLHATRHSIDTPKISQDCLHSLLNYPWPGNVREMENAIRSAVIYSKDGVVRPDMLPPHVVAGKAGRADDPSVTKFFSGQLEPTLENRIGLTEKDIIEQTLLENSFSRTQTARQLGISRVTLYNKMKKYGMMPGK